MRLRLTILAGLVMALLLAACGAPASATGAAAPPPAPLPPSPYSLSAPSGWYAPVRGSTGDFTVEGYTEFVVLRTPDENSWLFEVPGPTLVYPSGAAVFAPKHRGEITDDEERELARHLLNINPGLQQIRLSDGSTVTR